MIRAAVFVALFAGLFLPMFLLFMAGAFSQEERDRARARRLADARMSARLLRLEI